MKIAAAQLRPAWLDPARGTQQILDAIAHAASEGVRVLAFGETFLGGYPFWVSPGDGARFDDPVQKECFRRYLEAAVAADGPELHAIAAASREHGVLVVLGFAERAADTARGTIYCSLAFIDPERGIGPVHRKLMPTFEERLVWGHGDGHGLRVHVFEGVRFSALNCWENWMPQARHALLAQSPDCHFSLWPGAVRLTGEITRFVAKEGRMWHLATSALLDPALLPADFPVRDRMPEDIGYDGGSALAGPDGNWRIEPVTHREAIVSGDIDLDLVRRERQLFDPVGHYSRPDVFRVTVDRTRRRAAHFEED